MSTPSMPANDAWVERGEEMLGHFDHVRSALNQDAYAELFAATDALNKQALETTDKQPGEYFRLASMPVGMHRSQAWGLIIGDEASFPPRIVHEKQDMFGTRVQSLYFTIPRSYPRNVVDMPIASNRAKVASFTFESIRRRQAGDRILSEHTVSSRTTRKLIDLVNRNIATI